jgi:hypothetical protein
MSKNDIVIIAHLWSAPQPIKAYLITQCPVDARTRQESGRKLSETG